MSWLKTLSTISYLILAVLIAAIAFYWLRRKVEQTKSDRIKHLNKLDDFETTQTSSPLPDPTKFAQKRGIESTQRRFDLILRILIPLIVLLLLFLMILPTLSQAPAIYVSVFLAVFTVLFGTAAKPFIENVISGVIISLTQPVRVGDTVSIDDHYGTIERISLTYTVIKRWDWTRYVIPNTSFLSKEIRNYTLSDRYRWAYIEFWVAPCTDLSLVEQLAVQAVGSSQYCQKYEDPSFWIMGLEKEGIRCWVAGWSNSPGDAWMLMHESRFNLAKLFQENNIELHSIKLEIQQPSPPISKSPAN